MHKSNALQSAGEVVLLTSLLTLMSLDPVSRPAPRKLILVTQACGFVHDVVKRENGQASRVEQTFHQLARESGLFDVEVTDDISLLTSARLREASVVAFYTTGDLPLEDGQF